MKPQRVLISWLHGGDTSASFTFSLLRMSLYEQARLGVAHNILPTLCGSGDIDGGRNKVASVFLDSDADWLFFIDSDMGFAPDALERLLAAADKNTRPIIGGLCFAQKHGGQDLELASEVHYPTPTLYKFRDLGDVAGFEPELDYPPDTLAKVDATGAAFLLMHRSALTKITAWADELGQRPFDKMKNPRCEGFFSEDLSFSLRAAAAGVPIHVHTGVKTSHHKGGVYWTEESYQRFRLTEQVIAELTAEAAEASAEPLPVA